jgi:hypothetical protein
MLFAVDDHGVPSLAKMVRVDEAPAGPPEPGRPSAPVSAGGVAGATATHAGRFVALPAELALRDGRVRMRLSCLQGTGCAGRLSVTRVGARGRSMLLGVRRASVPARGARTVAVRLRSGRLGTRRRLRVRIEFGGRDAVGTLLRVARGATLDAYPPNVRRSAA